MAFNISQPINRMFIVRFFICIQKIKSPTINQLMRKIPKYDKVVS